MKLFIAIFLIMLQSISVASEAIEITYSNWEPFYSKDDTNSQIHLNIIKQIFDEIGQPYKLVWYPDWGAALNTVIHGRHHIAAAWGCTKERSKDLYFTKAFTFDEMVFFHNKKFIFDWKKTEDLDRFKIGIVESYNYGEFFGEYIKNHPQNIEFSAKDESSFKKLFAGRVEIIAANRHIGYHIIDRELSESEKAKYTHHKEALLASPLRFLLSKKIESTKELIPRIDAAIKKIVKLDEQQEMLEKSTTPCVKEANSN